MLIDYVVRRKIKIRDAAEMSGIGYENAKQILKVYKHEGRKTTLLFKNKSKKKSRRTYLRTVQVVQGPVMQA
jgi:transposase